MLVPRLSGLVLTLLQHAGLDQGHEPRGDPVAWGARARHDLVEAAGGPAHLAHDEQRPALADDLQRRGDGARTTGQVREHDWCAQGHAAIVRRVSSKVKLMAPHAGGTM